MIGGTEFNARSLPAAEIPGWFVAPEAHFSPLLSRDHTVMVGPRGSGKTTLLKMLTINALENWQSTEAEKYINEIRFNAALVPGDTLWGRQLEDASNLSEDLGEKIFVAHTIRAFVRSMKDVVVASEASNRRETQHLHAKISPRGEAELADTLADVFNLEIRLKSLTGLIHVFDKLLADAERIENSQAFAGRNLPGLLSATVSVFNETVGTPERQWALLFDELEIAPERIRSLLMSLLRSTDQRLIFKLALAPYTPLAVREDPQSAQLKHDYNVVSLSYPNKDEAQIFVRQIAEKVFSEYDGEPINLDHIFGPSNFRVTTTNKPTRKVDRSTSRSKRSEASKRFALPDEFLSLAGKDSSFKDYFERTGLSKRTPRNENDRAQFIRKVSPIVKVRDYYLSRYSDGQIKRLRSRKSHELYTGLPTILEVADGNPRALLTMLVPMARAYRFTVESGNPAEVPRALQVEAVRRAEFLQASLLNVIPSDADGSEAKGLLGFVDDIGRALQARLLSGPFRPDLYCSFNVDRNVTDKEVAAIGQALNVGAIVYVPHKDASPDGVLKGLRGMRFRLSYSLSARYRLPPTLGDSINLSTLLKQARSDDSDQLSFFED